MMRTVRTVQHWAKRWGRIIKRPVAWSRAGMGALIENTAAIRLKLDIEPFRSM